MKNSLFSALKRYKHSLETRFGHTIRRRQFNTVIDERLVTQFRLLARHLEIPVYVVVEHTAQLGLAELGPLTTDPDLKEDLIRHLTKNHLLVGLPDLEVEPRSERASKIFNAIRFLELIEKGGNEKERRSIIDFLIKEYSPLRKNKGGLRESRSTQDEAG